jgi:hypothetical protein
LSEATLSKAVPDYRLPYKPLAVDFTAALDEAASGTTIDLSFSSAISELTSSDITVTDSAGSVLAATLTGSGTNWQLTLDKALHEGNITVRVADWFIYGVGTKPQTVAIHRTVAAVLTDTVTEAKTIAHGGRYQTGKWTAAQDAIAAVEAVLADPNATSEQISTAQATLDKALTALGYTDTSFVFVDGDEYVSGADTDLVCVLARDLSLHNGVVKLDGRTLAEGVDYRVEAGSTKLTLLAGALSGLGAGDHIVAVGFNNGDVNAPFTTLGADTLTTLPATGDTMLPLPLIALIALLAALFLTRLRLGKR